MYKNVTVTTKAKDYIFILHSAGMTSIKVRDLPADLRQQLGYVDETKPQPTDPWSKVKKQAAQIALPQLVQWEQRLHLNRISSLPIGTWMSRERLATLLFAALLLYLFVCYCCSVICTKAGAPSGMMVWFPVVQVLPLLRAANMSRWWFVAFFVPLLNLVAQVLWSFKIVQVRGKNAGLALLLLLPGLNVLALAYLAFSGTPEPARKEAPAVQIMTLDAA
jgi:hypothetical protein